MATGRDDEEELPDFGSEEEKGNEEEGKEKEENKEGKYCEKSPGDNGPEGWRKAQKARTACKFYLQNRCNKGELCHYRHTKEEDPKDTRNGDCK